VLVQKLGLSTEILNACIYRVFFSDTLLYAMSHSFALELTVKSKEENVTLLALNLLKDAVLENMYLYITLKL
jgi:hypothetical protein